ncbi:AAA family ATPase [Actinomadura barringtoniae]|uniref:AAA family ATPase n=1 Tax=Actinomadura barringtoniae TaxID=1427535 RepID=A0A939PIK6_9ACTN|nr:LuxR C-terminal-related transcriptional regulator [Actinomadura barringtoniae]MBO2453095.1 AAA family ATPase [Actinomadura barringtoniae]
MDTFHRRTGTLPAEVTGFVGRWRELAEVSGLLERARLVSIVGPGGVGKTRLALHVASKSAGRFPEGVFFVELSGLRDPDLLPHTVATALGLPEQTSGDALDALLDYLRKRTGLLLILDTCEHMLDSCAMLTDLMLHEAPNVTVLATSRQPLDVPGEHCRSIAPLPVPEGGGQPGSGDALELFAQRAAAVVAGFEITEGNRELVTTLCRRLDGMPLAIELATVRLRALPLERLAKLLEERFKLTGTRRTAMSRHQTLRTAIDWSHELCTPGERLLWARLSVFAGTFDVAAVEEVCSGGELPDEDVLDALIGLVDKSVLLREDGGGDRYRMLDTLREYGAERLAMAGGQEEVRRRHVARYLGLVQDFDTHFHEDGQLAAYLALFAQHADLRAALEYACDLPGSDRDAAVLATRSWGYWQISGLLTEGRYWLTKVLDRFPGECAERAGMLTVRAYLATFQSDPRSAAGDVREAVPMAEALGETKTAGRALVYEHLVLTFTGRFEEAAEVSLRARERLEAVDDQMALAKLDCQDGHLYHLQGKADLAIDYCARGLQRFPEGSKECWIRGYLLYVSSVAHYRNADFAASAEAASAALRCKSALSDSIGIAYCLETFLFLAVEYGAYPRAAWLLGATEPLWELAGSRFSGTAQMDELHRAAETATREALGDERYEQLRVMGAEALLPQVVEAAISGSEDLPSVPRQRRTGRGGDPLTRRELEVARLVAEGLSNREIADQLVISKRTVGAHVEHILSKLGVSSRLQVAAMLPPAMPDDTDEPEPDSAPIKVIPISRTRPEMPRRETGP